MKHNKTPLRKSRDTITLLTIILIALTVAVIVLATRIDSQAKDLGDWNPALNTMQVG